MAAKPSPDYDIFPRLAAFLDTHLTFPVLSFVESLEIYDPKDVATSRLELAKRTKMSDYIIDCYKEVHGADAAIPKELEDVKAQVESEWRMHMDAIAPFLELIAIHPETGTVVPTHTGAEVISSGEFTPDLLAEKHGITAETIEALYRCAKFRYECGEYEIAADFLKYYRELVPVESEQSLRAVWGKFVADIVATRFEDADKDRDELRGAISRASGMSELQSLQHRSWLLHWSLFVFCNLPQGGKELLIEFFLLDSNLNAITLNCPWLLRYLTAAVLTSKKRHVLTKQLLRILTQESIGYSDPITEFMVALLHRFDFEAAQATLAQCSGVIATDFFLSSLTSDSELMESARRLLFETYCRIHQKIGLDTLASKLHMSEADAEKWLIELITQAQLDAKIDSTERQVVMAVPRPSVYQQVIEKTRDLTVRTRVLADNIDAAVTEGGAGAGGFGRYRGGGERH